MKRVKITRQSLVLLLMMLPGIVYLIINNYIPMAGIVLAFKKYNYAEGIWGSDWTGFSNFKYLLQTKDAYIMIRNTILYNLVFIFLGNAFAVFVAIILNEVKNQLARKWYQTLILIPYLISMVVVSYIVYAFLGTDTGFINNAILGGENINWYAKEEAWPFILTIVHVWKHFGYSSIIYYATIIGIDKALYEAAIVDGANRLQRVFHVTLPGIKLTVITLVLLAIGRIFRSDFGLFYQVPQNSGLISDATMTIDVYVYKGVTQMNDIGRASAAGFFQAVCGFIFVLLANFIVRKLDRESAMF